MLNPGPPKASDPSPPTPEDALLPAFSARDGSPLLDGPGGRLIGSAAPVILFEDEMMADGPITSTDSPPMGGVVCPFCAHIRTDAGGSCPKCTMEDTASTRRSTGERIGPWFVLQRKNPTAPGLRLSVLLTLARRGHVTPKSIVRGPTTGQFWRYAAQVKGLSRVFGLCWHCGSGVSPDASTCPKCRSAQEIPDEPDQFLESHAALPVMREVAGARELESPTATQDSEDRALPVPRRDLPEHRGPVTPRDLAVRDSKAGPGTRSVTLARGEDDVFLSASELAAAFQLDLPKQPGIVKRTSRRLWRVTRAAALLLILVGGATATTFYLKPDLYKQARDVARPYVDRTQSFALRMLGRQPRKSSTLEDLSQLPPITPIQLEPGSGKSQTNQDSSTNGNKIASDRDSLPLEPLPKARSVWSGTNSPGAVNADAPIDALAGQASGFLPTTKTSVSTSQALAEFPNIVESIIAKQEPAKPNQPTVVSPTELPKAPNAGSGTTPMSLDDAIAAAASLRTSALDAEARKEWSAAVTIYEQIAKLPEAAHPSDLKVKLAVARDRARS